MKTFKDLEFQQHSSIQDGTIAKLNLEDGSQISIITGKGTYSGTNSFEMMSNRTNSRDGIRGWIDIKQINTHLKYIQKNPLK